MTIAFGAAGASDVGTTSLSLPYPAGITAGQMLVMFIASKYPANPPTTPAGWQAQVGASGGSGAAGVDTGTALASFFTRIADGTETGNVAVTITGGNACRGIIARYTRDASKTWGVATAVAPQNTGNTNTWTATATTNPGISAGDMVLTGDAVNSDIFAWDTHAVTATGATFGASTERLESATTNGDDLDCVLADHPCATGRATAAPVRTMVATGTATTDSPAGATAFLVLREVVIPPFSLGLGLGVGL